MFEVFKKAVGQATAAAAEPPPAHDDPGGHDGHDGHHEDHRVPGVPPDPLALMPWMDHDHHPAAAPAAAPAPAKDPKEAMADLQAQTYASLLMVERGGTDSKQGHYAFLNTLDRVDDPVVRHKMMQKFAEQTGQSLQDFIKGADWEGGRDKDQALDLISEKRDQTEAKLAAMSPEQRKQLQGKASGWAQQVLAATTIDDANDDDNVQKITRVLGPRSPEEIEAIRAEVRKNTHGEHSIYEALDRSLSGGNEDEAVAGLSGDPVYAAQVGLRNADGDPKRIKELLHGMDARQLADLKQRNLMFGTGWIAASVPEGADRAEIEKLVAGDRTGADGERIANLLKDPRDGMKFDGMMPSAQTKRDMEARKTDNVIKELEGKSPEELAAARAAWDKQAATSGGKTFEQMLDERFGSDDSTDKLRIGALLRGDRASDKVLELREGMKDRKQSEIEDALANPDLESSDPKKRAAAEQEKARIEQLARDQDAREQHVMAIFTGNDPSKVEGRGVDQQLAAHYRDVVDHPDTPTSLDAMMAQAVDPDGERKKRELQAQDDHVASKEDWTAGRLSTATQIYRAQQKGDTKTEAQLLENTKSNQGLADLNLDYAAKYGARHDKQMIEAPKLDNFAVQAQMAKLHGDDRPVEAIEAELAHDDLNANELRIDNVRQYGVKAERDPALQLALQQELYAKQHSDSLDSHEQMRAYFGGGFGTEELAREQLAVEDDMLTPGGPFGMTPRKLRDGVSKDDFHQVDNNLTSTLETQRDEKVKYANHIASVLTTVAKIAALAVGQPELVALIDVASGLGAMALKSQIAGEAYDPAVDAKLLAINTAVDLATIGIARAGKGATLGEEGVEQVTKEAGVAEGALAGEASSTEGQLIQEAGTTEGALAKDTEGALAKDAEGGVASQAGKTESAFAKEAEAAEGSLAKDAGEVAQPAWKTGATLGVNAAGTAASGAVQGKSPTDILGDVVKGGLTALLPAHFAGKVQEALGDATKAEEILGHIFGAATEFGTAATINAGDGKQGLISAAVQTIGGRANKLLTQPRSPSGVETAEAPGEGETILGAPGGEVPSGSEPAGGTAPAAPPSHGDVPAHERVTQQMAAPEVPAHERVTEKMPSVTPEEAAGTTETVETHGEQHEQETDKKLEQPHDLQEHIDVATGVNKGPAYEQFRNDMQSFYANQEREAANVTTVKDQRYESKKDGTRIVVNSQYDARTFSYDNAQLRQVDMDLHLRPGSNVGEADLAKIRSDTVAGVDEYYNFGEDGHLHQLPDGSTLQVEVNFVDDPASADLVVGVEPPGTDAATGRKLKTVQNQWITSQVNPTVAAHELGHQLNLLDEYVDPETWFREADNSPGVFQDSSLMGNFFKEAGPTEIKPRHLDRLGRDMASAGHTPLTKATNDAETKVDAPAPSDADQARIAVPGVSQDGGMMSEPVTGPPMDGQRFEKMKRAFERHRGSIIQDADAQAYLQSRGANAVTFNDTTMLLRTEPTASEVFEVFIYAAQYRTGRATGANVTEMEIEAAEKLIRNRGPYGITPIETLQTIARLRRLREKLAQERAKK